MASTSDIAQRLFRKFPLENGEWRSVLMQAIARDASLQEGVAALLDFLKGRQHALLPAPRLVFHALEATPPSAVRVIILGQDPYPTPGDAHGLAFSVQRAHDLPRSLRNVASEVERDTGLKLASGDLTHWAGQGVLLLNAVLTLGAEEGDSERSHQGQGWERITTAILRAVLMRGGPCVVLCWGKKAAATLAAAGTPSAGVRVLYATHPSPLSFRRAVSGFPAFQGCGHFQAANDFLSQHASPVINWGTPLAARYPRGSSGGRS
jgi:uracil-DNA glycosylase